MRCIENPLITPESIPPTRADFEVVSVINPAVTQYNGQVILLMRVCERPISQSGKLRTPVLDLKNSEVKIKTFSLNDPQLQYSDVRVFKYNNRSYLTTMSHLRIARSSNGIDFVTDEKPFIFPYGPDEEYGIEDARITKINSIFYIYYVAVSRYGISTVLAETEDFESFKRLGMIFAPQNKDVAVFPQRINGKYYALFRPDTGDFANPCMWIGSSDDLLHWGNYTYLMGPRPNTWDSKRIGAGTVPLKTDHGWLEIYHGASDKDVYSLGLILLDLEDPSKVLFRSEKPFFSPVESYERLGFFSDVVFTNGMTVLPGTDTLMLYYGAADTCICAARLDMQELFGYLRIHSNR